ncbi:hypothetical protein [Streptomyces sp. ISL-100]|uniref:hypothetical protein n=1 Tax=Streptomyces sp. ISL-100 TaxID=2819173 RepID=UPI0027E3E02D|nr:hypothetical protein [Streptomyces sp. ISL-100]
MGIDAHEFAVGDEVIAYARKDCVHGRTFAEFVTVPVRALARRPASLTWDQAAVCRWPVSRLPGADAPVHRSG